MVSVGRMSAHESAWEIFVQNDFLFFSSEWNDDFSPMISGESTNNYSMYFILYAILKIFLFIFGCGLSLAVASGGYSSLRCAGFSLQWLLLLQSTGSRRAGFSSCGMRAQ